MSVECCRSWWVVLMVEVWCVSAMDEERQRYLGCGIVRRFHLF